MVANRGGAARATDITVASHGFLPESNPEVAFQWLESRTSSVIHQQHLLS